MTAITILKTQLLFMKPVACSMKLFWWPNHFANSFSVWCPVKSPSPFSYSLPSEWMFPAAWLCGWSGRTKCLNYSYPNFIQWNHWIPFLWDHFGSWLSAIHFIWLPPHVMQPSLLKRISAVFLPCHWYICWTWVNKNNILEYISPKT